MAYMFLTDNTVKEFKNSIKDCIKKKTSRMVPVLGDFKFQINSTKDTIEIIIRRRDGSYVSKDVGSLLCGKLHLSNNATQGRDESKKNLCIVLGTKLPIFKE